MLDAFTHYRSGFLPVVGGMQDQAVPFVQGMDLMSRLFAQHEEIEAERHG